MKLTVLVDNNTLIDKYFLGEPGVSYYIEEGSIKILFDTGYSDIYLKNAGKLGIDLKKIDYVVFSHGHLDHTNGITYLDSELSKENNTIKPTIIAHPDTFYPKIFIGEGDIGSVLKENQLKKNFSLKLSKEPIWLTKKLVFLGEIKRDNDFESNQPIGKTTINGIEKDDFVLDDSALVYKSNDGLVIITGCSHSGICNIIDYSKAVCNEDKVVDVIGGLHLLDPSQEQLDSTIDYFKQTTLKQIHACHCTDLNSKIKLSKVLEVKEVGVGLKINYE